MHPSPSPNDATRGRFPAIMRHKIRKQSKATQISSLQHPPVDIPQVVSGRQVETFDTSKYKSKDTDLYRRVSHPMETTTTDYGMSELATPNRFHHLASTPMRTPIRPPSRLHALIVSPPNPHRMTRPYRQNPPQFFPFQSPALTPITKPHRTDMSIMVGHPSLNIHRLHLPHNLLHLLDSIVLDCEAYAATQPNGWLTDLYSLTKQDVALREIPHLFEASKPIVAYITKCMTQLWGVERLSMDKNQPHVLKYADGHTGVELHHDKCDITANLCLSRPSSYVGGG
jgi:hypothetical protein